MTRSVKRQYAHVFAKKFCSICAKIVIAFIAILFALGIVELFLRVTRPEYLDRATVRERFGVFDTNLGWFNRPGVEGRMLTPFAAKEKHGQEVYDVHVAINERGFRDKEYTVVKDAAYRIIVLGDSFVWGFGVEQNEVFTEIVESDLTKTEVINMGCAGFGQDQALLLLESIGLKYQPDLIISVIHFDSDIHNNASSYAYGYNKPVFVERQGQLVRSHASVPGLTVGDHVNRWLTGRFAIWNLIKLQRISKNSLEKMFVQAVNQMLSENAARVIDTNIPEVELMARLIQKTKQRAMEHSALYLAVIVPNVKQGAQAIWHDNRYSQLLTYLDRLQIDYIDLQPKFLQYFKNNPGATITFAQDRHWNSRGHRVVANHLIGYLVQNYGLELNKSE